MTEDDTPVIRIRALETAVRRLQRGQNELLRQVKTWRTLDKLAEVAPALVALHEHAEQLSLLASATPAILEQVQRGADETSFRKIFQERFGQDPDAPGIWMMRALGGLANSKWLRGTLAAAIGLLLGSIATVLITGWLHAHGWIK